MKDGNKIKLKMSAAPLLILLLYFHVKEWDNLFNNNRNSGTSNGLTERC